MERPFQPPMHVAGAQRIAHELEEGRPAFARGARVQGVGLGLGFGLFRVVTGV